MVHRFLKRFSWLAGRLSADHAAAVPTSFQEGRLVIMPGWVHSRDQPPVRVVMRPLRTHSASSGRFKEVPAGKCGSAGLTAGSGPRCRGCRDTT